MARNLILQDGVVSDLFESLGVSRNSTGVLIEFTMGKAITIHESRLMTAEEVERLRDAFRTLDPTPLGSSPGI